MPSDHLYFSYGARVGARWDDVTDDLLRAVEGFLPTLHELATLDGLLRSADRPQLDLYHAEVHLCVALIRGDEKRFRQLGEEVVAWKEQVAWERPIIDRCTGLSETVRAEGEEVGVRMPRARPWGP